MYKGNGAAPKQHHRVRACLRAEGGVAFGTPRELAERYLECLTPPNICPQTLHLPPVAIFMAHFLHRAAWPHGRQEYSISADLHTRQGLESFELSRGGLQASIVVTYVIQAGLVLYDLPDIAAG